MDRNQDNKFRKITTGILATILMLGTAVGAGFSLASTANQVSDKQNFESSYKQKLQLEINVDGNLETAAKNSINTLEFLGISGSNVYTIGSNKLVAEIPVESYNDKTGYSLFSTDGLGINDYITESETLALSLLVQGDIEFKTTDGQSLFTLDGNGKPQFVAPTFDTSGGTSSSPQYKNLTSSSEDVPVLFSNASVGHYNGSPYISLTPKNDYAKNALINWDEWVNNSSHSADTETQYVAWLDYSELEKFVTDSGRFSDYDSTTGLFSYVYDQNTGNVKSFAKPFLISFGQPYQINKYSDEFRLTGNFSERQAKFFADKINQRKEYSFDYSTLSSNLIVSSKSKVLLYVMEVIILIIVILVLILFVWYFGLLGSIGVVSVLLSTLIATTVFVSLSLQISLISLLAILFAICASALSSARAINIYKKEKDRSKSKSKKFAKNASEIATYLFVPTFISTLLLFVVGFMMPLAISSVVYFVTLNILISYGLTLLFVTPMLFIYDLILSFSTVEVNSKWDLISGVGINRTLNFTIINTSKWNAKKISVSSIIVVLIVAVFGGIIGGILYSTTGSAVNERGFKNISYVYNVENTGDFFEISDPTYSADKTEQELYDEVNSVKADVKKTFSDNGVNVKSMYVVRDENYSMEDSKAKLEVNYGYQVLTSKEISTSTIDAINGSLTGFEINKDSLSANNGGKINFYSTNQLFIKFIILIAVLLLVSFILFLTFFRWGIGTAFLATMMFEFTGVIAPLLILFLPFNLFMLLPLIFVASLSIISKIDIARRMRNDNNKEDWFELSNKQQSTSTLAYSALLIVEILLMISYGFLTILPIMFVTVISWVPTMLSSNIIFPYIATKFVTMREDDKTTKMNSDLRDSKNPNITTEELIEGINM